jgi:hypothetical protein
VESKLNRNPAKSKIKWYVVPVHGNAQAKLV